MLQVGRKCTHGSGSDDDDVDAEDDEGDKMMVVLETIRVFQKTVRLIQVMF